MNEFLLFAVLSQFADIARRDWLLAQLIQASHDSLPGNSAPILLAY